MEHSTISKARTYKTDATIHGDGVAAVCTARLLTDAGVKCKLETIVRPKLAAVLLGQQTQHLLREVFPDEPTSAGLFRGFTSIKKRIVLWGAAKDATVLPHIGLVAPEEDLLGRLWRFVPQDQVASGEGEETEAWRILSSWERQAGDASVNLSYGNRTARFARIRLRGEVGEDACWVESLPDGWLFLLSLGGREASLISVGGKTETLLGASRLIGQSIDHIRNESTEASAAPRLRLPLVTGHSVACGGAALRFDPLCGEGVGNAVREAFLASAMVRAALEGEDEASLADHYISRMMRGFRRHLEHCLEFYRTGGTGDFWRSEAASTEKGIVEIGKLLERLPPSRYVLQDRKLVAV